MPRDQSTETRLPKGVTRLARDRGGRAFLAKIRRGKGFEVHLGLYESAGLAAFAFNVASVALGRSSRPPNEVDRSDQPSAAQVVFITDKVHRRLGLVTDREERDESPPDLESLMTLFEITVVGFWRGQAAQGDSGSDLDSAGRRLAEAARIVFWSRGAGRPTPAEVLARLLGRRLDQGFRRSDLTRAILDDDGDDAWRVARWLALPDVFPAGRGFRDEVRALYPDEFDDSGPESVGLPYWASVLGLDPPFTTARVKDAYRLRSKAAHPDAGGSHAAFIRLQAAYDEGRDHCRVMGV